MTIIPSCLQDDDESERREGDNEEGLGSGGPDTRDQSHGDGCSGWGGQTGCQKTLGKEKTSTPTNTIKDSI